MTQARGILSFLTSCGALAPAPVSLAGDVVRTGGGPLDRLEEEKRYRIAFDNSGRSENHSGADLMRNGLARKLTVEPASFEALE